MVEKSAQSPRSSTLSISDEDLQTSLRDFLKTDEEKEKRSIWNIRTLSGLAFIFISLAFVGHSIGVELFGATGIPFLERLIGLTPYFAGAMVGVICLGFLKQSKQKEKIKRTESRNRETYDRLDDFLYSDTASAETKSRKKSRTKMYDTSIRASGGLSRSRTDRKLMGVCGGLAKYLGVNSTALRIGFLIAFFLSTGTFTLLYIAMAVVMPKEAIHEMDDFN
jgi:phage shock protein C